MSIIIAAANMTRVVVKCDGLVRDPDNGELQDQDYESMVNLNDNCIVGYNGKKEHCEMVLSQYKRLAAEAGIDINSLKPTTVIFDLCELTKVMNDNNSSISFLTAGKEEGRILLFGFSSTDGYSINNFSPEDYNNIKYITLGKDTAPGEMQYDKFYRPDKPMELTMNAYIRYLSVNDADINDNIFTRKIKLR